MEETISGQRLHPLPTPDPTVLTTAALTRESDRLGELLDMRIASERDARVAADAGLVASVELQSSIREEQFKGVAREFALLERQRVEQKVDSTVSLAAALSAAKEAVGLNTLSFEKSINKSENATNEQLKQLNVTFVTALSGIEGQIGDLKDRVAKNEKVQAAVGGVGQGKQQSWGILIASIVGAGSLFGIVMLIIELAVPR